MGSSEITRDHTFTGSMPVGATLKTLGSAGDSRSVAHP